MKWLIVLTALAAVALANAAAVDFHLWLKCKAIELYINVTGVNYTLPQCALLLNYTLPPGVPMIGVGELKKLNVSDPREVFVQLREIRLAALRNLTSHVNRAVLREYHKINASRGLEEAVNNTERGIKTLVKVERLLEKVNASEHAKAVRQGVVWLNRTIEMLKLNETKWFEVRNETDVERVIADIEKTMEHIRRLLDHFEKIKIAQLHQLISAKYKALNATREILRDLKNVEPQWWREIRDAVVRGDVEKIREIARKARGNRGEPPGKK